VFAWSYEEISGIDPITEENEIMTYLNSKLVRQNLHLVNPRKEATIKAEVEKLLNASFIYQVPLT